MEHKKFIQRLYWLMQDCGMPHKVPERSLLVEIYEMIQDHAEYFDVELD